MSDKVLIIFKDGDERRVPIDRERIVLGRDPGCDVVLTDESVSRRHAAVHFKHDAVYIENISATGRVLRDGEAVEYVELSESDEVSVGSFSISWAIESAKESASAKAEASAPPEESNESTYDPGVVAADSNEPAFQAPSFETPAEEPKLPSADEASAPDLGDMALVASSAPADENEKTLVGAAPVAPRLRIVKGPAEEIGRELRLTGGPQWIVGRSPKAHVQIDHSKFSRQHFVIQRIGTQYRVQDMGSANGTRINGVAVTDAPIQPFDTIQIGPFELQFVLVDSDAQHLAAIASPPPLPGLSLETASPAFASASSHDETKFVPPVPYDPLQGFQANSASSPYGGGMPSTPSPTPQAPPAGEADKSPLVRQARKLGVWFNSQPPEKKRLYIVGASLALGVVLLARMGATGPATDPADQVATIEAPATAGPSPASAVPLQAEGNISPEFYALSAEKRAEIEDLYRKAEKARSTQDWNTAYESAAAIARQVPRYKDTNAILEESQALILDRKIGTLSQSSSRVEDAARETGEKVTALMESGTKALAEGRFEDADETFHKVLNYDPTHAEAQAGIVAARTRQNSIVPIELPKAEVAEFQDVHSGERQKERESIDAFKNRFQDIRRAMQEGRFKEASPMLLDLESQVAARVEEYDQGGRAPAAIRPEFRQESASLLTQVREARDTTKTQLRAEFQSQIADAEQHVANQQYALARDSYDRILRVVPNFEEVLEARRRLYDRLLAEAKFKYNEALVSESVGDVEGAIDGYTKTRELLSNVDDANAVEYFKKAVTRMSRLK